MTSPLDVIAGQYTQPAARIIAPPMWIVLINARDSVALATALIDAGAHFGYQTWPDQPQVMVVLFAPSPLAAPLRTLCEQYGSVRGWEAHLDVTGRWEEYQP